MRNGSMPSSRTAILDAPQPSVTIGISFIKSKQSSDDDPQSSDETDYGKVSQKVGNAYHFSLKSDEEKMTKIKDG